MAIERVEFSEAIGEKLLFKTSWDKLKVPQQVILRAIYGLPLVSAEELDVWSALNGFGLYNEIGELQGVAKRVAYIPEEKEDITLIVGRRFAKTSMISSFMIAYEALCGGHKAHVSAKQDPHFVQVSQDLATSKASLRQFILDHLEASPIGHKELGNLTQSVTADQIRLKRGLITVGPPTIKLRGQAIAMCAMDELAFWAKDKEAANPDVEIQHAVRPAMAQFPFRKLIKTSTPWTEEGLLWEDYTARQEGRLAPRQMVLKGPTALAKNPAIPLSYLRTELNKDAEAFRREYLAEFAKSVSGFMSPSLLRASAPLGKRRAPPQPGRWYVGVLDPAFRRDAFAFSIGHLEGGAFHLDLCESWSGTRENPISPLVTLSAIAVMAKEYGLRTLVSDQYHLESLSELAQQVGLLIEPSPINTELKNRMWGEMQGLLNQGRLHLLDDPELLDQLSKMEKRLTSGGAIQYTGGAGHDDKAMVVALNAHRCLLMGESRESASAPTKMPDSLASLYWDGYFKQQAGKQRQGEGSAWWA